MHLEAEASKVMEDEVRSDLQFAVEQECKSSVIDVEYAEDLKESSVGE